MERLFSQLLYYLSGAYGNMVDLYDMYPRQIQTKQALRKFSEAAQDKD